MTRKKQNSLYVSLYPNPIWKDALTRDEMAPLAPIYNVSFCTNNEPGADTSSCIENILKEIAPQLKQNGPLDQLIISGEGGPENMSGTVDGYTNALNIAWFLMRLEKIQESLGVQIAKKIVFAGCDTFSLGNDDKEGMFLSFLHRQAQRLNTDISGAISLKMTSPIMYDTAAEYVTFTHDGKIIRDDKLNERFMGLIPIAIYDKYDQIVRKFDGNRSWFEDCFEGKTFDQGMACLQEQTPSVFSTKKGRSK
jgi:hypothetical protein